MSINFVRRFNIKPNAAILLLVAMLALPLALQAYSFKVGGLCYRVTSTADKTVSVTWEKTYGDFIPSYNNISGKVVIPATVNYNGITWAITSIDDNAFRSCDRITEVIVSEGVTSIGVMSFEACRAMKNITLPSTLVLINYYGLENCEGLESIVCKAAEPPICLGKYALALNVNTTYVYNDFCKVYVESTSVPKYQRANGWKEFPINALPSDDYLKLAYTIVKDNHVEVRALSTGKYKGVVNIPAEFDYNGTHYIVDGIGAYAFAGCNELTDVNIPDAITYINNSAFENCTQLRSIKIPASISKVGLKAFKGCSNLTTVDYYSVTGDATSVGGETSMWKTPVFMDCESLKTINIGNTVKIIPDCIFKYTKISTIEIPDNVLEIVNDAFAECSNLKELTIGKGVQKIHNACFGFGDKDECKLETVYYNAVAMKQYTANGLYYPFYNNTFKNLVIGDCVQSLPNNAFRECKSITNITVNAIDPPVLGSYCFANVDKQLCTVKVPKASVNKYSVASGWNKFKISAIESDDVSYALYSENCVTSDFSEFKFPIYLKNENAITSFQFDLTLPSGISLATEDSDYKIELNNLRSSGHIVSANVQSNGTIRVVGYSMYNKNIKDNNGLLLTLGLVCDQVSPGTYDAAISNIHLSDKNATDIVATPYISSIRVDKREITRGDTNGDNNVTISDAVNIINYILELPTSTFIKDVADVNNDGLITVADATAVINLILNDRKSAPQQLSLENNISRAAEQQSNYLQLSVSNNNSNSKAIGVSLNNEDQFTACQMDIVLPTGCSIEKDEDDEYIFTSTSRLRKSHMFVSNLISDRVVRLIVFSNKSEAIKDNSGELFSFNVVFNSANGNNGSVIIQNIRFTKMDASDVPFTDVQCELTTNSIPETLCDSEETPVYYDLSGRIIKEPAVPGLYIVRKGQHSEKVILK